MNEGDLHIKIEKVLGDGKREVVLDGHYYAIGDSRNRPSQEARYFLAGKTLVFTGSGFPRRFNSF